MIVVRYRIFVISTCKVLILPITSWNTYQVTFASAYLSSNSNACSTSVVLSSMWEREKSESWNTLPSPKRVKISSSWKGLTGDFILIADPLKSNMTALKLKQEVWKLFQDTQYTFMSILETLYCPQNCWNNCMIRHICTGSMSLES